MRSVMSDGASPNSHYQESAYQCDSSEQQEVSEVFQYGDKRTTLRITSRSINLRPRPSHVVEDPEVKELACRHRHREEDKRRVAAKC